jgi:hypothetical protein
LNSCWAGAYYAAHQVEKAPEYWTLPPGFDINLSCTAATLKFLNSGALPMIFKTHFFRWLAIPACVICGLIELAALQRSKLTGRRSGLGA